MRVTSRVVAALAVCALVASAPALASGFSIYEQGAKASGMAGAWTARADDASANWYNPAALTRLDGMQAQFGIQVITIGSDTQLYSGDPAFGLPATVQFDTVEHNVTPIQLYVTGHLNDRWAWGIGINNPFGLVTEWEDRPVTLSSKKAELVTFVINPNVAYKINDYWSVALGLDYMFADIGEFSREVNQGQVNPLLNGQYLTSNLTGDGTDFGWNVALHYASENWKAGLSYRAEMSPEIEGDVEFTNVHPALDALGLFPDGPGTATLDLPATAAVGLAWTPGDWELEVDVAYAGWSAFENLAIDFANETPAVQDVVQREDWEDTYSYRFGASRTITPRQQVRFGAVYDENPIPDDTLRPSIPDGDRYAFTFGYGFAGKTWGFDAYYMPLFFRDRDAAGNAAEGVIDGTYESFVHLLGVSLSYRF